MALLEERLNLVAFEKEQFQKKYEALEASRQQYADDANKNLKKELDDKVAENERMLVDLCQKHSNELDQIKLDYECKLAEQTLAKENQSLKNDELLQASLRIASATLVLILNKRIRYLFRNWAICPANLNRQKLK